MPVALALAMAFVISYGLANPVAALLGSCLQRQNYRGQGIPTAAGLALLPGAWLGIALFSPAPMAPLFWLTTACLAGFVDDVAGDKKFRGFRGHFGALARGHLSSGMVKVVLIAASGAIVFARPWSWESGLKLLVALLAVNLMNQLDLRPGRVLKVSLLLLLPAALMGQVGAAAAAGAGLGLLGGDLRARFMLGDAGANLLGAAVGMALIQDLSTVGLMAAALSLMFLNLCGDLLSFTRVIEAIPPLRWLDNLGRRQQE